MSNIPQDLKDEYGVGEGCILNLKPNRHVKVMAGEIQCLVERIARLTEEIARLEAENTRLKTLVSDEEWSTYRVRLDTCDESGEMDGWDWLIGRK